MKTSSLLTRSKQIALAALAGFGIGLAGSASWFALLGTNLRTSPTIPWAEPAMVVVLWLGWQYLGGRWWPARTSALRRSLLRSRLVPAPMFAWAAAAGLLALVALAGLWIVLVRLTGYGGNPTIPSTAAFPALVVVLLVVVASLVSPLTEEAAFRGYSQVLLERSFPPVVAVAISSAFFALWHGPTQGFVWSKLLFFFLVGLVFGTIAYLTNSVLPALPVHIAADLLFFAVIWPGDATRTLVWTHGPDGWFWLNVVQVPVFTVLAVAALRRLARLRSRESRLSPAGWA